MKHLLLVTAVSIPAPALSFGGWASTTVENVPEFAITGKPIDITYTVRQHGMTLLSKLNGTVTISAGDYSRTFAAFEVGEGMYRFVHDRVQQAAHFTVPAVSVPLGRRPWLLQHRQFLLVAARSLSSVPHTVLSITRSAAAIFRGRIWAATFDSACW